MSFCFAVGIPKRAPIMRQTSGVRVIEYIQYNIREEDTDSIDLVGDLFLPNPDKKKKIFSFVHRGNVNFKSLRSKQILAPNDFYTAFLQNFYAPSMNCRLDREKGKFLRVGEMDDNAVAIRGTDLYCDTLMRQDDTNSPNIPFSLYHIEIPEQTLGFVRICGKIEGETLDRLTRDKTSFGVYGGEILLDLIRSRDLPVRTFSGENSVDTIHREWYETAFNEFVENSYIEPDQYDMILWSSPGTKRVTTERLSRDLFLGCEKYMLQGNRIDWYWSRSANFHVCSYPNGLRVGITFSESGKTDKQIAVHGGK